MKKLLIFLPFFLFAKILSPLQESLLNKDLNSAIINGDKLKDSWINPITLQYKYNRTNQPNTIQKTNSFFIGINQPIFKSGAIWASIKYANALKDENIQKTKLQKATLIKQAYEILFNIRKIEIAIKKQKFLIDNANIDIKRKKEQFLSGITDSSFLDNAIINKNNLELALNDMLLQKEKLINSFKNLSDLDYQKIQLPHFELISKEKYLNNLNIQIAKKEMKVKKALKYMNIGNSLFSLNLIANYNYIDTKYDKQSLLLQDDKDNFYNIGLSVTIPLDINSFKTIESAKIDYLKSTLKYKDELLKASNEYDTEIKTIQNLDKKIKVYQSTINSYVSLIKNTKDNIKAGINTSLDLENLKNSLEIARLNKKTLEIDKEIELLNLYYLQGFR